MLSILLDGKWPENDSENPGRFSEFTQAASHKEGLDHCLQAFSAPKDATAVSLDWPSRIVLRETALNLDPARLWVSHRFQAPAHWSSQQDSASSARSIPIIDIPKIAAVLAQSKDPQAQLPIEIHQAARAAIFHRKKFSEWYRKNGIGEEESNRGHEYFTERLEEALQHLTSTTHSNTTTEAPDNECYNKFIALAPENDDYDDPLDSKPEPVEQHAKSAKPRPPVVYDIKASDESDSKFQLFCFLDELAAIRQHIRTLWERFTHEKIDLHIAATITNKAILAVSEFEDQIIALNSNRVEKQRSWINLVGLLSTVVDSRRDAGEYNDIATESVSIEISQLMHLPTSLSLFQIAATVRRRTPQEAGEALLLNSHVGDQPFPRPSDPVNFANEPDAEFLRRLLIHVHLRELLRRLEGDYVLPEDEVTKAIGRLCSKHEESVTVAFAAQILLDIRHELGANIYDPDQICWPENITGDTGYNFPKNTLSSLRRYAFMLRMLRKPRAFAEDRVKFSKRTQTCCSQQNNEKSISTQTDAARSIEYADVIFQSNPVLCGTIACNILLERETLGVTFMNHHLTVFAMAHLYHATRQLGFLVSRWPGMDDAINIYQQRIFGKYLPETKHQIYVSTKAGGSLQFFAPNVRNERKKLLSGKGNPTLDESGVGTILSRYSCSRGSASPLMSLIELEKLLANSTRRIRMNHIPLTRLCGNLLRRVRQLIDTKLNIPYPVECPSAGDSNDIGLAQMVLGILHAVDTEKNGGPQQIQIVADVLRKCLPPPPP